MGNNNKKKEIAALEGSIEGLAISLAIYNARLKIEKASEPKDEVQQSILDVINSEIKDIRTEMAEAVTKLTSIDPTNPLILNLKKSREDAKIKGTALGICKGMLGYLGSMGMVEKFLNKVVDLWIEQYDLRKAKLNEANPGEDADLIFCALEYALGHFGEMIELIERDTAVVSNPEGMKSSAFPEKIQKIMGSMTRKDPKDENLVQ